MSRSMCCFACARSGRRCSTTFREGRSGVYSLVEIRSAGRRRVRLREDQEQEVMAELLAVLSDEEASAEQKVARALALLATGAAGAAAGGRTAEAEPAQESRRRRRTLADLDEMLRQARELTAWQKRQPAPHLRYAILPPSGPAGPNPIREAIRNHGGER